MDQLQVYPYEGPRPIPRGDNTDKVKYIDNVKNIYPRATGPISIQTWHKACLSDESLGQFYTIYLLVYQP